MRTSLAQGVTAAVGVAVLLSGCGGSEDESAPSAVETSELPPPTPEPAETLVDPLSSDDVGTEAESESLPSSFNAPPPEESAVSGVTELGTDVIVAFNVPGDQLAAGEAYRSQLEEAGFTIVSEQGTNSSTGEKGLSLRVESGTFSMQVTTGTDRFEPDQATIDCSYTTDPA